MGHVATQNDWYRTKNVVKLTARTMITVTLDKAKKTPMIETIKKIQN